MFETILYVVVIISGAIGLLLRLNEYMCPHNWVYLGETHRFCTICHRLEQHMDYDPSYDLGVPDIEGLKRRYKK